MRRSIKFRVDSYLQLFGRLGLVMQCLGMGSSRVPTITLSASDIWTKAFDDAESERFDFNQLFHGSIVGYINRPELNRYKRSGEPRHLALLPF